MTGADYAAFAELTYEDFRRLARDEGLSPYERIGFPDSYRAGFEAAIFADIRAKLPALDARGSTVVDIGPGCSELPQMMRALSDANEHRLFLVDSPEMLEHHAAGPNVHKIAGRFPDDVPADALPAGGADAVIAYSVLHYVYPDGNVHGFVDAAMQLLAPGGALLVGDIPNGSMRNRFLASPAGVEFHQRVAGEGAVPEVRFNELEPGRLDDAVLLGLVAHARLSGFHAWLVPQGPDLPMANRREDLLVMRP